MPISTYFKCGTCLFWQGDREGGPTEEGLCRRFPPNGENTISLMNMTGAPALEYEGTFTNTRTTTLETVCGEWKHWQLIHGGLPVDPVESP